MTKEEAWKIIEICKGWNISQKGHDVIFNNVAPENCQEHQILLAKKSALAKAWAIVGEAEQEGK